MEEIGPGEKMVEVSSLGQEEQDLLKASVRARESAYCPYSQFSVGAAVKVSSGTVYTGCNIENAAYPVGLCAERTAMAKAVSEGNITFSAVAVSGSESGSSGKKFTFPCGSCRQFISEFARDKDVTIYVVKPDLKHVIITSIKQLLPHDFHF